MTQRLWTCVLVVAVCAACARNPVTGKRQLSLISRDQEIALGQQAKEEIVQGLGLVADPELQRYVSQIGLEMAKRSERPDLPWSFQVIDDPSVNAFALPGGPIFVTRGILTHLNSEAELAIVLGHEIGHVTAKHAVTQLSRQQLAQVGIGVGSIFLPERLRGLGQLAGAGAGLLFLKHGRDAERQSDDLAFRYALQEGYDVREMTDVFKTLSAASAGQGRLPEWLSTHPNPENRVTAAQQLVAQVDPARLQALKEDRAEYLSHLDGVVFGENPRNGYFQHSRFLHPDLRFELTFPARWPTVNQAATVAAVSPEQDAVVALGLAGTLSPQEAERQFFSAQGVRPVEGPTGQLSPLPSVSRFFVAQTEQGPIGGLVTFVSHGGKTLQLIGYTPQQLLERYASTFQQVAATLRPLTDPQALAVQPARIAIVDLAKAMTLQQAYTELRPGVPLETFALINGFRPEEQVPAGTKLKNVIGSPAPAPAPPTAAVR